MTDPIVCTNCGRDYSTRECADPEHRAQRGIPANATPTHRTCRAKDHPGERCLPLAAFRDRRTGKQFKTCNDCRTRARQRRKTSRQGAPRNTIATFDLDGTLGDTPEGRDRIRGRQRRNLYLDRHRDRLETAAASSDQRRSEEVYDRTR